MSYDKKINRKFIYLLQFKDFTIKVNGSLLPLMIGGTSNNSFLYFINIFTWLFQ